MGAAPGSISDSLTGALLAGRYRVGRVRGHGGMGTVYEAVQENMDRPVAVKVLRAELANEPEVLVRFRREAETIASLRHPNIVAVSDFEQPEGEAPFLVMELLNGESLRARIARMGAQDANVVVTIAMQILSALEAAHGAGIVHRDLKPDNVFVVEHVDGTMQAKLLDFGVAKLMESDEYTRLTATGVLLGTPSYMAPELLAGRVADARSDLYAVGVTMYGALAGRLPFRGKTTTELMRAVLAGSPEPLAAARPDLPRSLCRVIERAMSLHPDDRYADARAMREALINVRPELVSSGGSRRPSLHPPFDRPLSNAPPPPPPNLDAIPVAKPPSNLDAIPAASPPAEVPDETQTIPLMRPSHPPAARIGSGMLTQNEVPTVTDHSPFAVGSPTPSHGEERNRAHPEGISTRSLVALAVFAVLCVAILVIVAVTR
jgi:serine/threonine protein kinase